ncbi:MAG: ABC-F family ATP-binding cassette domain-containing protein [Lachnospiraceae bacterium]|nr:ABC-F family ATP-binding cassette domain-containing protein [Lachnospiraceae bacterium]
MILSCNNIEKSFDGNTILSKCSFIANEHEKIAVVGINGAGKSTLLKIIMKELPADSGDVIIAKDTSIGYLAQHQDVSSENSIYEELLTVKKEILDMERKMRSLELQMKTLAGEELESALKTYTNLTHQFELQNGYACKSEVTGVLKGLGFTEEEFGKSISTLSGGQKTRVSLGKLLLSRPDIILLDEPTNHLDIGSITWLENYLSNYNGTVIIVAHDRYFLDKVVSKIVEIDKGKVTVFSGNYTDYANKKAMLRDAELKQYINQQREIKHQEEVITKLRSFNREKSIRRAESRQKMLDKIEVLDKPDGPDKTMRFCLEPKVLSGNDVLTVEGLSKAFGSRMLFENLDFQIKRGEKVAIIGNNGTGKTTILKIINCLIPPDSGEIFLGSKVNIGYYDQEHHVLDMEKTIFDEISDAYPNLTNTEIRNVLAAFLFTGEDVFKLIGDLSGGERGRVSLAKLMLSEANFIILDEPTNHLDIQSKEILEDALNDYTGTVLYVSHDRYFINRTATRILDLEGQMLTSYLGDYDYYLEKHEQLSEGTTQAVKNETGSISASKEDWKSRKEEQARKRKLENDIKKTEEKITETEQKIEELNEVLTKEEVYTVPEKCMEVQKDLDAASEILNKLYEEWEKLLLEANT